jgi:RNA polymerase sigma-70 factor, ECF subfamily
LRAQCGDREALELLLGRAQSWLRRYLSGLVGSGDADDVLQDVLVILYRKLTWLDDPELFRPWSLRIAGRAAFRWLKRRKRWDDLVAHEFTPEQIPSPDTRPTDDLLSQLSRIDGISAASRAVLVLHFQEELSLSDVAAILEIPLGTAKSRLAYGLAALRRQLDRNRRI